MFLSLHMFLSLQPTGICDACNDMGTYNIHWTMTCGQSWTMWMKHAGT